MATAEIGALRVTLGMDAGEFHSGADKANKKLSAMDKQAAASAKIIGAALVAAAGAMVYATRQALEFADNIGKMAQRVGIGAETLSGLVHAAALADVNIQGLDGALDKFNRTLGDSAKLNSEADRAFSALGVSVRNAAGQMRPTEEILLDVADRFAGFADGANKSALAMQLFGRAGADLIPLLNSGRAGIKDAAEEARRFGVSVDKDFAKNAEAFNDSITRLKAALNGWAMDVAKTVAGPGAELINWLADATSKWRELHNESTDKAGEWLKLFGQMGALQSATAEWERMGRAVRDLHETRQKILKDGTVEDLRDIEAQIRHATAAMAAAEEKMKDIRSGRTQIGEWRTTVTVEQPEAPNVEAIQQALEERLATVRATGLAMKDALEDALNPDFRPFLIGLDSTADKFRMVEDAARANAIGFREASKLFIDLKKQERQAIADTATMFGQTLSTVFKKSKAAASAEAIINTAVGITKVWREVPWPLNLAQAAMVAASGVAQLAAINSASESGGGTAPSATGGASGDAGAAEAPSRGLTIMGVDPGHMFSGVQVQRLIEAINGEVQNGATLISSGAGPG